MDYSMPSSSSSLFNILQLAEDGSNWVTYKQRMTIALGAHGLGEYVDGTIPIPPRFVTDSTGIVKDANVRGHLSVSLLPLSSPTLPFVHMYFPHTSSPFTETTLKG
jgi:hypothetical protein